MAGGGAQRAAYRDPRHTCGLGFWPAALRPRACRAAGGGRAAGGLGEVGGRYPHVVRILHFLTRVRLADGGVVRALIDIATLLSRAGDAVTVATTEMDEPARRALEGAGVATLPVRIVDPVARLRGRRVQDAPGDQPTQMLDRASRVALWMLLAQAPTRPDVVHLHGVWATPNWQVASLARKACVPYVVSAHGMLDDWCVAQGRAKKRVHMALVSARGLAGARAVHCTARAEAEQVARNVPRAIATRVVALPFDAAEFDDVPDARDDPDRVRREASFQAAFPGVDPRDGADDGARARDGGVAAPRVVFLSRLHAKKGVVPLIEAWGAVRSRHAGASLLLAGPYDPPEYERTVREAITRLGPGGAGAGVQVLGMVRGASKRALLAAADVFVLPTSQENFGYVLLESLAAGTPVITTRAVDIWPELEASGACTILDGSPVAPTALAEAIGRALSDVGALRAAGVRGRAWARAYAYPEALVLAYRSMYGGMSEDALISDCSHRDHAHKAV